MCIQNLDRGQEKIAKRNDETDATDTHLVLYALVAYCTFIFKASTVSVKIAQKKSLDFVSFFFVLKPYEYNLIGNTPGLAWKKSYPNIIMD